MKSNIIYILSIVALLSYVSIHSQKINKTKLDSLFSTLDNKVMGSMVITKNNKKVYSNSIGYSSIDKKLKNSNKTKYRIGSITKMYTAVMIFQLIDNKKLDIKTSLAAYFPNIKNAQKITIGNLLNHTSGIFNFTNHKNFNPYLAQTHEQMLTTIEKFKPDFEPNSQTAYSNTNFILLGYILENIYDNSYARILESHIVNKLGLKNTYFGSIISSENNEAFSYTYNKEWKKSKETDMSLPHGAGAIVSTPDELTIFMNALMEGKLISQKSFKRMIPLKNGLGYGIGQFSVYDKILFGHNGGIDGFTSLLIYEPKEKISIAFTSNGSTLDIKDIVIDGLTASMNIRFTKTPSFVVSTKQLAKYTGSYSSEDVPFVLTFRVEGGQLMGGPPADSNNVLKAIEKHQFILEKEGAILDFNPENNTLILSQGGKTFTFTKN